MNRDKIIDELLAFLDFLLKEGYCDSDVYAEEPTALDQYLKGRKIDSLYSRGVSEDMKSCMYCENIVNYSEGIFTCYECSHPTNKLNKAQQDKLNITPEISDGECYIECNTTDPDSIYIDANDNDGKWIGWLKKVPPPQQPSEEALYEAMNLVWEDGRCNMIKPQESCFDDYWKRKKEMIYKRLQSRQQPVSEGEIEGVLKQFAVSKLVGNDDSYRKQIAAAIKELLDR